MYHYSLDSAGLVFVAFIMDQTGENCSRINSRQKSIVNSLKKNTRVCGITKVMSRSDYSNWISGVTIKKDVYLIFTIQWQLI